MLGCGPRPGLPGDVTPVPQRWPFLHATLAIVQWTRVGRRGPVEAVGWLAGRRRAGPGRAGHAEPADVRCEELRLVEGDLAQVLPHVAAAIV